jgi:C4-dicarboxylate transporter DctQ subunit
VLARADTVLGWLEEAFIGAALAFASALLFANVVLRYVFLAPIGWAEELSLYLIVWIVFIGASVAVRTRGHIAIDLLAVSLSPANRRRLRLATGAVVLVFLAVFFYYSALHTNRVRMSGQVTPVMLAPMWLTYLAMPVGSALMFLRACQLLLAVYRDTSEAEERLELQD